jgi:hypothetical protein
MASVGLSGPERGLMDLRKTYDPYPMQRRFHASTAPYSFMGGAAGPGKTMAMIMEQFTACNEFNLDDGPKVHTLLLRRTNPKLEATVITRFRESVDKSLYAKFNETKSEVTWLNGATTKFGSMQYDHNAWDYQGQWFHIGYDEMCEFTFNQWMATSAWNRCPVSRYSKKYGAGNPIGVGALWVEDLFVKHRPCQYMEDSQKASYRPDDYDYFPATYLDNPVYANDPTFLKNLEAYPEAIRNALKYGQWGVAGGYFQGAWDEAVHVYKHLDLKPWWKRWISGDWGFEHWSAIYKHAMDDHGVVYTYDELMVQHQPPEMLAETIGEWAQEDGRMPHFQNFAFSHDANSSNATKTFGANTNSVFNRMTPTLREYGIPAPHVSTRDKIGREQMMYDLLVKRIHTGEDADGHSVECPAWMISNKCESLIRVIPIAKRDDLDKEKIESFDGDDPLQGASYGLYAIFGKPAEKPRSVQLAEVLEGVPNNTQKAIVAKRFDVDWAKSHKPVRRQLRWTRPGLPQ